jgi:hypothetical protein
MGVVWGAPARPILRGYNLLDLENIMRNPRLYARGRNLRRYNLLDLKKKRWVNDLIRILVHVERGLLDLHVNARYAHFQLSLRGSKAIKVEIINNISSPVGLAGHFRQEVRH